MRDLIPDIDTRAKYFKCWIEHAFPKPFMIADGIAGFLSMAFGALNYFYPNLDRTLAVIGVFVPLGILIILLTIQFILAPYKIHTIYYTAIKTLAGSTPLESARTRLRQLIEEGEWIKTSFDQNKLLAWETETLAFLNRALGTVKASAFADCPKGIANIDEYEGQFRKYVEAEVGSLRSILSELGSTDVDPSYRSFGAGIPHR